MPSALWADDECPAPGTTTCVTASWLLCRCGVTINCEIMTDASVFRKKKSKLQLDFCDESAHLVSMESLNITPVILCGGSGTRLWPRSRAVKPKPFIPLIGDETLFEQALSRF